MLSTEYQLPCKAAFQDYVISPLPVNNECLGMGWGQSQWGPEGPAGPLAPWFPTFLTPKLFSTLLLLWRPPTMT